MKRLKNILFILGIISFNVFMAFLYFHYLIPLIVLYTFPGDNFVIPIITAIWSMSCGLVSAYFTRFLQNFVFKAKVLFGIAITLLIVVYLYLEYSIALQYLEILKKVKELIGNSVIIETYVWREKTNRIRR